MGALDYVVVVTCFTVLFFYVRRRFNKLEGKENTIMATVDEVKASFAKFVGDVKTKLDALQAKVDAGSAVESADLDGIKAAVDEADAALNPPA